MIELEQDLWEVPADARCITTNGYRKKNGAAVMGRGCAYEAKTLIPGIDRFLGHKLGAIGNHVHFLINHDIYGDIYSFPVKHHWRHNADWGLVKRSTKELIAIADEMSYPKIVIPRPGCGNGNLDWEMDVGEFMFDHLDDRFIVVHY